MKRTSRALAAASLALALSACGDSSKPSGGEASAPPALTTADCTTPGGALGYVDQRQKKLMDDVKANKPVGDKLNGFLAKSTEEAEKAKTSNDWVAYCKAVDAYLTGIGY